MPHIVPFNLDNRRAPTQQCGWFHDGVRVGLLAERSSPRPLTSLQQRLVKTGGRLVTHARYHWLMLAESHLTRRMFESIRRIGALAVGDGVDKGDGHCEIRATRT